jgi:hypothetical protein
MKKTIVAVAFAGAFVCAAAQDSGHPMNRSHADHAMGFSQDKTTHHFRLYKDGGAVEVEANDPQDIASAAQVRSHLQHIAQMFSEGNFEIPMLVHDQTPPGATAMKRLAKDIKYTYESIAHGGRVRIQTRNAEALAAVHEFLRFQIKEHKTGDSQDVSGRAR